MFFFISCNFENTFQNVGFLLCYVCSYVTIRTCSFIRVLMRNKSLKHDEAPIQATGLCIGR